MVTAAQMLTSKTAFRNAGSTFNTCRTALNSAHIASKPAQEALYEWLLTVRAVLARRLGSRWSPAWAEAGFVTTTTRVPDTIKGRIALGLSLVTYYTTNPTFEVPDMEVTAAKATQLTEAAVAGQSTVTTAEQALEDANNVRQPARTDLLGLMSEVIANLNKKLAANDPALARFWPANAIDANDAGQAAECDRDLKRRWRDFGAVRSGGAGRSLSRPDDDPRCGYEVSPGL